MKNQWIVAGMAVLVSLSGSGCRVVCEFQKMRGGRLVKPYLETCRGLIVTCTGTNPNCRNVLKMECGGIPIYSGPYSVNIKNNKIRYTASNWHGSDAPFITTIIPENDHDVVKAFEQDDDDKQAHGFCRYDFNAN